MTDLKQARREFMSKFDIGNELCNLHGAHVVCSIHEGYWINQGGMPMGFYGWELHKEPEQETKSFSCIEDFSRWVGDRNYLMRYNDNNVRFNYWISIDDIKRSFEISFDHGTTWIKVVGK